MCSMKWEKDEDGNSCQSDYLMDMEHQAEERIKSSAQEGVSNGG